MRIALVTRAIGPNDGQGRVNSEIAKEALRQGHELVLFCEEAAPELACQAAQTRLFPPARAVPGRLARDQLFALRSMPGLAAERARGAVILANGFASWAAADVNAVHFVHSAWVASPQHPWALRRTARTAYARAYSVVNAGLERAAFARTRGMIAAVSEKVRQELIDTCGVAPGRVATILNGVDTDEFRPAGGKAEAEAARAAFGLPAGVPLALFAGDLRTPRKNLDTVLAALARAPGLHLAVAGRHEATPWPAMAERLGLSGRVHFLGFQRAMPALMRAADLFVFPSRYEACSLVLLEALASGLPVLTARTAGGAEIVTPETGTVLADSEDRDALAAAMTALVADPARHAAMAAAARRVALRHQWSGMAARYLDLLARAEAARNTQARRAPRHAVHPLKEAADA